MQEDQLLHEMASVLERASKMQAWEEGLDPAIKNGWFMTKQAFGRIDSLLKKFKSARITKHDLLMIRLTWKDTAKVLKIQEVSLSLCELDRDTYSGVTFRSLEGLDDFINRYDNPTSSLIVERLGDELHELKIKFE